MTKPIFIINKIPIPPSFYGKILKYCGGDRELTARIFFRAHHARAVDPMAWISAGMKKGGYAYNACALETTNPKVVREWIDDLFPAKPQRIDSILVDTLENMLAKAKGIA